MKLVKGKIFLLGIGLLLGIAAVPANAMEVMGADGEIIPEGFRLEYVHIDDEIYRDWTADGTKTLKTNWWNSSTTGPDGRKTYELGDEIGNTNVYPLYVPEDESAFLIYNGSWSGTNQTVNISLSEPTAAVTRMSALDGLGVTPYEDSQVIYNITGSTDGAGKYSVSLTTKRDFSISSEYARYWLDRGGRDVGYFWFLAFNAGTEAEPEWKAIQASDYPPIADPEAGSKYLAYFDVPVSFIGKNYFAFTLNDYFWVTENEDNTTDPLTLVSSDFSKIHRIEWVDEGGAYWSMKLDNGGVYSMLEAGSVLPSFLADYVLPAYYTCLNSEANGYMAASEIIDTWVSNDRLLGGMDALGEVSVQDYAYAGPGTDYNEYYKNNERTITTTALEKLNTMLTLEEAATVDTTGYVASFFSAPENITAFTSGALILVSILGFSLFFIIRKRKESRL